MHKFAAPPPQENPYLCSHGIEMKTVVVVHYIAFRFSVLQADAKLLKCLIPCAPPHWRFVVAPLELTKVEQKGLRVTAVNFKVYVH